MKECYCCQRDFEDKYIYEVNVRVCGEGEFKQFFCCRFCCSFPV